MRFFRFLKIFIFIMFLFLNINVFASNVSVSNKIKYSTSSSKGTYAGDEIYLGGYNGQFTVGTRYNGRLSMLSFYLSTDDYNFSTNHTYTITLNMATEDWRNNFMGPQVVNAQSNGSLGSSLSVSNFRFVSYKQVKFNFKTSGILTPYLFFRLYSTDYASTNNIAITGTNNWNLSSIYINDNVSSTPTPVPVTPTPSPTPQPNNQDIINNANQNTQDIISNQNENNQNLIDNNNQNTTDIIDNANSNTESINNNLNSVCKSGPYNLTETFIDKSLIGKELGSNGSINNWVSGTITKYLSVKPREDYTISFSGGTVGSVYYCLYAADKSVLSCSAYNNRYDINFNSGAYVAFIRLTVPIYSNMSIKGSICNDFLAEAQNDTTNAINNVNNSINNSSIDDKTGFFSNFENNNHGLTGIITLPLTTIQSLANTSCVSLDVPIPYTNSNISLPCMSTVYQTYIPTVYSIWQVVSFGLISYFICLDIFKLVKGFKDPNEDKVEVLDL